MDGTFSGGGMTFGLPLAPLVGELASVARLRGFGNPIPRYAGTSPKRGSKEGLRGYFP